MQPSLATINRFALVVKPSATLVDWVNRTYPDDQVEMSALQGHDHLEVFLIPEFTSLEEAESWVRLNFKVFVEYLLESWCAEPADWPPVEWQTFDSFFSWSLESMVVDTVEPDYDE